MKFDWRVAASGAGLLIAAGAVVGGVALAQPAATHPHRAPAAVQTTTSTPAPTAPVAATTSAAPATSAPVVSPSTHHIVRPKETTVSEPQAQPSTSNEPAPVAGPSDAPKPVLPPMPPAPSTPTVTPPVMSGAESPSN